MVADLGPEALNRDAYGAVARVRYGVPSFLGNHEKAVAIDREVGGRVGGFEDALLADGVPHMCGDAARDIFARRPDRNERRKRGVRALMPVVLAFAMLSATVPSRLDCASMPDALVLIIAEMLIM